MWSRYEKKNVAHWLMTHALDFCEEGVEQLVP